MNECVGLQRHNALRNLERNQVPFYIEDHTLQFSVKIYCSYAQSSSGDARMDTGHADNVNITSSVVCDPSKTTCFVEAEAIVKSSLAMPKMPSKIETRFETIKDFLAKPYLVGNVQYSTSTAANGNLLTLPIGNLLSTTSYWADKIRGFNLYRGTFVLRVQVNANPFQAGRLLIHYLPCYTQYVLIDNNYAQKVNANLLAKFQHPCIELDMRETAAIFKIPWIAPTEYFDLKNQLFDWGTVFVDAVTPLLVGASAPKNYVEVNFYGYWEDVELAAPSVPQAGSKDKVRRRKGFEVNHMDVEQEEAKPGPIANGLSAVASAASSLSVIPILAPITGPVEWMARVGSQVASIFGWSKPRVNNNQTIVFPQTLRYAATSDGSDPSFPLALIADNRVKTSDDYSITGEDEMSLKFLLSIPTFYSTIPWTVGTAVGTSLFSQKMYPDAFYTQGTVTHNSHTATFRQGAPLWYLNKLFMYWRGSWDITLKFVKTEFHSGRIQVTWTPNKTVTGGVTDLTSTLSLREIIDIREQTEVTLNLPYMIPESYLWTDSTASFSGNTSYYSGQIDIQILNDLMAPETCPQTIDILVFLKAGPDFEYQVPGQPGGVGYPGYFSSQSSSQDTIVSTGIAESAIQHVDMMHSSLSIGEHFVSIKQLLNRFSQLFSFDGFTTQASLGVYPFGYSSVSMNTSTGALSSIGFGGDIASLLVPMYAFQRGSARVALSVSNNTSSIMATLMPGSYHAHGQLTKNYFSPSMYPGGVGMGPVAPGNFVTGAALLAPAYSTAIADDGPSICYAQVPYQSRFPISLIPVSDGNVNTTNVYQNDFFPTQTVAFTIGTEAVSVSTSSLFRNFGDDFQLSFFVCAPPLLTAYV
jgi:hypothetical protein